MQHSREDKTFEALVASLCEPAKLQAYKQTYDHYKPSLVPVLLGTFLVACGNLVYGREPSYLKFRAVEVIARVPYHSWESAAYTLLTMFYSREKKALELSHVTRFSRLAQDNETMHVVVISKLAREEERAGVIRHTLIPMFFAFFYFWWSYFLYLINPRYSFELNYLFEQHAFDSYSRFLQTRGQELAQKPMHSGFLNWYGRHPRTQYDFFLSVRNDEIIHRNSSIEEIERRRKEREQKRQATS